MGPPCPCPSNLLWPSDFQELDHFCSWDHWLPPRLMIPPSAPPRPLLIPPPSPLPNPAPSPPPSPAPRSPPSPAPRSPPSPAPRSPPSPPAIRPPPIWLPSIPSCKFPSAKRQSNVKKSNENIYMREGESERERKRERERERCCTYNPAGTHHNTRTHRNTRGKTLRSWCFI